MSDPSDLNINPATATEEELESFRRQWREEVSARARFAQASSATAQSSAQATSSTTRPSQRNNAPVIPERPKDAHVEDAEPHAYHDFGEKQLGRKLAEPPSEPEKAPVSALDHYEEAVRRETQGKLGDSVNLYRKAFKLDAAVQDIYKKKHFPAGAFAKHKPANPNPSNAPVTVPSTAHHSLAGFSSNVTDLVSSFASLSIPGEEPPTDLSPAPPCPISDLPEELLADILMYVAVEDVAQFARMSQVCKRMAYLVMTEDRVWRRLALGDEFGFAAMHYKWACRLDGKPLGDDGEGGRLLSSYTGLPDSEEEGEKQEVARRAKLLESALHTLPLVPDPYPSFRSLFRSRPRVRFNGCYISTVNYTRPGAQQSNTLTWGVPVLIVTYFRYLRFFRDGSCISLLTTAEPADVVPHLSKQYLHGQNGAHAHSALPQAVMKDALLGRWRLSGPEHPVDPLLWPSSSSSSSPSTPAEPAAATGALPRQGAHEPPASLDAVLSPAETEGLVHVETAGVTPKYIYRMALALSNAGKGARNNKLAWQGYWSYNRLTDDWGEFGLKNDKPFYWSRVKSWS
ncbi:F-box domain cyclin-like protein [Macrophomina phaseolina MS6]|uniref:F-box domain cyclin-like protein n=1 Tax=Macrophomina phaseolina (strain MS6) TaxID=1126212 RepID=K2RQB7_MACPH|nr:F-box domain cyclin-like protein [Macrophomina phaseolina MS6]